MIDYTPTIRKFEKAQMMAESAGNSRAVSSAGAKGLFQFMPETAVQYNLRDPFNPEESRKAYYRKMNDLMNMFGGDSGLAIGAYGAGEANMKKHMAGQPSGFGKNSKAYVQKILANSGQTSEYFSKNPIVSGSSSGSKNPNIPGVSGGIVAPDDTATLSTIPTTFGNNMAQPTQPFVMPDTEYKKYYTAPEKALIPTKRKSSLNPGEQALLALGLTLLGNQGGTLGQNLGQGGINALNVFNNSAQADTKAEEDYVERLAATQKYNKALEEEANSKAKLELLRNTDWSKIPASQRGNFLLKAGLVNEGMRFMDSQQGNLPTGTYVGDDGQLHEVNIDGKTYTKFKQDTNPSYTGLTPYQQSQLNNSDRNNEIQMKQLEMQQLKFQEDLKKSQDEARKRDEERENPYNALKPNDTALAAQNERSVQSQTLDTTIKEIEGMSDDNFGTAKGLVRSYLPASTAGKIDSNYEKNISTFSKVGKISSEDIKDTSGAAVSASESTRLKPWIVQDTDTKSVVLDKLKNRQKFIQQETENFYKVYPRFAPKQEAPSTQPATPKPKITISNW